MKDKVTIQRTWIFDWLDTVSVCGVPSLGVSGGLTDDERANVRYEMAKEIDWAIHSPDDRLYGDIALRSNKIDALIAASEEGDISNFDPFYPYRKDLFDWMLT